jgi:hypothetical protein
VQRVLENTEVYRNRLAGREQKLQILADLYRPDAPQGKVLSYAAPAQGSDNGIPVPLPRPSDSTATSGAVAGGQAVIPASAPDTSSSAGTTPAPKPRPERR